MTDKMPCHISDGPQTPEDADEAWDRTFGTDDSDAACDAELQRSTDEYFARTMIDQPEVEDIAWTVGGLKRFFDDEFNRGS